MMTFYINEYGRFSLGFAHIHFTRDQADLFNVVERGPRIGVWRVRPKNPKAFQHCHLWASHAASLIDKLSERETARAKAHLDAVASSRVRA